MNLNPETGIMIIVGATSFMAGMVCMYVYFLLWLRSTVSRIAARHAITEEGRTIIRALGRAL